ncbi:anthranilate phosphoribosyltransferase [Pseudocyphellaria aurata]|nr:anthranilate phosphoribosyltransferase [Pseudocyphellaria aurata]
MALRIGSESSQLISISPVLKMLTGPSHHVVTADEVAAALALIFDNHISAIQCSSLLTVLHSTERDRDPKTIAKCAEIMRAAAAQIDLTVLREVLRSRKRVEGGYRGGLCDIVGTGGDGHATYNVSTTASILASSLLLLSKHGNRASSSGSGSADLLRAIKPTAPDIEAVTAQSLPLVYRKSNYAFLFAPKFHPGMKHVASVRKDLGFRTIFNLLGPLANPVEKMIEARVIGVAERALGPIFAEALRMSGAKKTIVVCGAENLDEISCAGKTFCWRLVEHPDPQFRRPESVEDDNHSTSDDDASSRTLVNIEPFELEPSDFGLSTHALSEVSPGELHQENALTLMQLLKNQMPDGAPVLDFVLINTAALFAISGICDADRSDMGHGDDGKVILEAGPGGLRWKEGVRRARWAIKSGQALSSLESFISITHNL